VARMAAHSPSAPAVSRAAVAGRLLMALASMAAAASWPGKLPWSARPAPSSARPPTGSPPW
jgi:hypothetical protein